MQPANDFPQQQRDGTVVAIRLDQVAKERVGIPHRQGIDLGDVFATDAGQQCFGAQAAAVAGRAGDVAAVPGQKNADVHAIGACLEPGEPATNALIIPTIAVDQGLPLLGREPGKGHIGGNTVAGAKGHEHAAFVARAGATPGFDGPVSQALTGIGNDQVHIQVNGAPKPLADLTRSQRAVEGKQVWHRVTVGDVALWAVQVLAEFLLQPIREVHHDQALPETQPLFK